MELDALLSIAKIPVIVHHHVGRQKGELAKKFRRTILHPKQPRLPSPTLWGSIARRERA
jgi:hypothetical protein